MRGAVVALCIWRIGGRRRGVNFSPSPGRDQPHWVLDVVFDEDRPRNRQGNGPQNLAILRKLALDLLRSPPHKASIRRKIKHAGWNDDFLISLLAQMR